jgi:D-xylose transport system ATP-binding protein
MMTMADEPQTENRAQTWSDTDTPLLELRNVSKWFGGVHALDDISLSLHRGEVVALVGDNGAGKSTLVKTIVGVHKPDKGEIRMEGERTSYSSPKGARELGIETVYQDLALVDTFDIPSNFFLGRELTVAKWLPILRSRAMQKEARTSISDLRVAIPSASSKVAQMSGGQRQGVAVARAAFWKAKVMLLDEPTAALGVRESGQVTRLLRELADRGTGMIVVSHKMEEVFRLSDTIVVLRQGKHIATARRSETTPEEVVGWITGAEAAGERL